MRKAGLLIFSSSYSISYWAEFDTKNWMETDRRNSIYSAAYHLIHEEDNIGNVGCCLTILQKKTDCGFDNHQNDYL